MPITLKAGEHVTADITLTPVPAFHARIKNLNPQIGIGVQVFQNVFGSRLPLMVQSQSMGAYREVLGLAPGALVLEIEEFGGRPEFWTRPNVGFDGKLISPNRKELALDVASDVEIDPSQSSGSPNVSGHVTLEGGTQLPSRVVIQLRNLASGEDAGVAVSPEGDFQFDSPSIQPGRYVLSTFNNGEVFVKTVTATGAKMSGRVVEIAGTGPVQLRVTLARGLAQIEGIALHGSKPDAGAMIVLVPQHPDDNAVLFRRDQSDSDGTFTLNAVVPGSYRVIAIENGWDLEWRSPAVLNAYLKKGQPVEVQPGGRYDVKVDVQ